MAALVLVGLTSVGCFAGNDSATIGEHPASQVASPTPQPTVTEPVESTQTIPDQHYWPDNPEDFNDAIDGCDLPESKFTATECTYLFSLIMATDAGYGQMIEHGVDLLETGYDACREMERISDPAMVDERLPLPAEWPADGDVLFSIAVAYASFILCPQHEDIGTWILTPQTIPPSPTT